MRIRIILLLLFASLQAMGQKLIDKVNAYSIPTGVAPEWFQKLYGKSVDVRELDKEVEEYLEAKYGEGIAEADEEELEERHVNEPFVVAYKHWRQAVAHLVDSKGMVSVESFKTARTHSALRTASVTPEGNWTELGPFETFNVLNDEPTQRSIPHQANVFKIEASVSHPNVVYCLTATNNVFKSVDKGKNWTCVSRTHTFWDANNAIAVHPTNPDIVYISGRGTVHKTTDGGVTWSMAKTLPNYPDVIELEIAPDDDQIILAATSDGLYRSKDAGASWYRVIKNKAYDVVFKWGNTSWVYAASKNDAGNTVVKLSMNKGETFNTVYTVTNREASDEDEGAVLGITPADPQRIYLLNVSAGVSIFRSKDGGTTWSMGATTASETARGNPDFNKFQAWYNLAMNVSSTNPDEIICGTVHTFKSVDGGMTLPYDIGLNPWPGHGDFQDICVNGTDTYVASDGGVVYSSDFYTTVANTETRMNGLTAGEFWHMDQGWDEDVVIGGRNHNGDGLVSELHGGKSLFVGGGETATGWVLHGQVRRVIAEDAGAITYPSTLTGPKSNFAYSKYPNHEIQQDQTSELLIDPVYYNHHYVGSGNELWESWDGGVTFKSIKTFSAGVAKMEIGRDNPKVLYVAVEGDPYLYISNDGGAGWTTQYLPGFWNGSRTDLAIHPQNSKVLWATNRYAVNGSKVYVTKDGGINWDIVPNTELNDLQTYDIRYAAGTNGGIYVSADNFNDVTEGPAHRSVVYYKDSTMNFINYSNGLPLYNMETCRARIFYRDAKIRMATSNGIWESPLYDASFKPVAQPSVDKKSPECSVLDTFNFYDYSILKYAGATRLWSFSPEPLYVSDKTSLRPQVVFGAPGSYSVTLKVTDGNGNSSTKTITNMVNVVTPSEMATDSIAGYALSFDGTNNAIVPALKKTATNVTMMAWIRKNGAQDFLAGIMVTKSRNENYGIQIKDNGSIGYEWKSQYWYEDNDSIVPDNKWTHVALVITPTSGTVYFNGTAVFINNNIHDGIDFENELYFGSHYGGGRNYKGQIDEFAIYNRAMTAKEIREQMHLTKKPSMESALIGYYQFNETSGKIYNKAASCNIGSSGATSVASTVPVGGGVSYTMSVTTGGTKNFSGTTAYPVGNTGVSLTFPASGTYPSGDVVVTRLNVKPDAVPASVRTNPQYWIINSYGTNATFSTLNALNFNQIGLVQSGEAASPSSVRLFARPAVAEGATWGSYKDLAESAVAGTNGSATFSTGNGVNSFRKQFIIGFAATTVNQPPVVSLTSPANNAGYTAPASITLSANASDPEGNLSKVEFYNASTLIATRTAAPYSYTWTGVGAGTYSITAKATDAQNATATTTPVTVTVTNTVNQSPVVSLTSPANNASYTAPASITLSANASDPEGNLSKVEFYNGSTLLASLTTAPYTYNWTGVSAGTYSITAKATDVQNAATTTSPVTVTVTTTTSTADIIGPDCGTSGASLSFEVNPVKWAGAYNFSWYYTNAGSLNPINTAKTTLTGAYPFAPANICVGFSDSKGVYHSNVCKYISTCSGARMDNVTGVDQIGSSARVKVYPNPANNVINLLIESADTDPLKVTLIDESSRTVIERTIILDKGSKGYELDVTDLKNGTYTMILSKTNNVLVKQIVIFK